MPWHTVKLNDGVSFNSLFAQIVVVEMPKSTFNARNLDSWHWVRHEPVAE